ncbi:hypothetical protein ADH76_24245 [Enterocloster clostridioformis]|uniref:Vacuolar (H+)-ATPase G subunit n=2 Tax=Enterocloster clostridioformis TaxID=1531 RepID=A0A227LEC6_9FIRM|nr:hypothetical protein [Enterocloster clostridioformis]ANU46644.1 hypothetical protein A4V08_13370 [Lachnoclostridium sp. YL32]ENZ05594.1 hypothetical protein HMPREF1086_02409 [[Clostridium] clostridioforme 90B1]ENZ13673.1 hypothetical protein HMPREF1090_02568 [[Clostridium] clostridioforme 90A8]ENZ26039.1 hypothetical protein HMPREF1087_02877 [[Clostridium] clostridioforme 90A1]ENZ26332.1 hypothetical protein HMPREF1088_00818 [[Clostridium] clostridioforme 90A3]ENZ72225.1 hypothetical prote
MSFCNTNVWSIVFPVAYLRKLTIYSGRIANGIPVQKGGFGLAQETIDAIRQAETAAEAAEKEAVKEAEAIVAEAKAQAAQMKAAMTKSARESAVGAEEDAKAQSEQMMQAAGAEEGKDLEALQKAVAEKQQKAVEVILSELL